MKAYDRVIQVGRRKAVIGFSDYTRFAGEIERLDSSQRILVDLAKTEFASPDGMVPLIAAIRHLTEQGWEVDVALPDSEFLSDYFDKAGWTSGIEGDPRPPLRARAATYMPLAEYQTVDELNPIMNETLEHFSRHSVYEPGVLEALEWSLNEIAGNVLDHAGGVSGWVQVSERPKKGLIEVVVADTGRGICASLHERFPDLADDRDAVRRAVEKGVTRDERIGQGNGLAGTLRIAIAANGYVNVYSGRGLLRYMPEVRITSNRTGTGAPLRAAANLFDDDISPHQGTIVTLTLPTRITLDLETALWGHRPVPRFELQHVDAGDPSRICFSVAEEAEGFGNRPSARPVRTKLQNLMNVFPDDQVVVDFSGVNLAAASFLDEFIARLAKDLGIVLFFERVRLTNMNSLVRSTLNAVLEQRLGERLLD